jgi:hypothetical protein
LLDRRPKPVATSASFAAAERLKAFLGDPADPNAPFGYAPCAAVDDAEDFPTEACSALDAYGLPRPAAQLADLLPTVDPPTRALANRLRDDLRALLDDARWLPADGCGVDANSAAFRLAERYTLLAAAACCIGVWQAGRLPTTAPDSTWLRALLGGLAARLGRPTPIDPDRDKALFGELTYPSGRRTRLLHRRRPRPPTPPPVAPNPKEPPWKPPSPPTPLWSTG